MPSSSGKGTALSSTETPPGTGSCSCYCSSDTQTSRFRLATANWHQSSRPILPIKHTRILLSAAAAKGEGHTNHPGSFITVLSTVFPHMLGKWKTPPCTRYLYPLPSPLPCSLRLRSGRVALLLAHTQPWSECLRLHTEPKLPHLLYLSLTQARERSLLFL